MWKRAILAMVIASILAPAIAAAQGRGQGQGRGSGSTGSGSGKAGGSEAKKGGDDKKAPDDVVFNRDDHDAFRDYFRAHNIKPEALPPGIAKNIARGKELPPGIAKKALPSDLVAKLGSRAQPGVSYNLIGDRVVALKDGKVIDVMEGLFR